MGDFFNILFRIINSIFLPWVDLGAPRGDGSLRGLKDVALLIIVLGIILLVLYYVYTLGF